MKRIDLVRHLESHGCRLLREGGSHSVFWNPATRKVSTVPRHREIKEYGPEDLPRFGDPGPLMPNETLKLPKDRYRAWRLAAPRLLESFAA